MNQPSSHEQGPRPNPLLDCDTGLDAARVSKPVLSALVKASAVINASLDLSETLRSIAESAAEVCCAEASSVLLLDATRSKLVFRAAVGNRAPQLLGDEFDARLGVAGRVATTGEPMLVANVNESRDFFRGIDDKSHFVTHSLIAAPMRHLGSTIGVIEVLNKLEGAQFTAVDLDVLMLFGNLAAISVSKAQTHEAVKRENRALRAVARQSDEVVGSSPALRAAMELVSRVAGTNASVLLLGETGTGKEVTARAIHERSPRAKRAFVAINCAALPETLLESELFGHEAGAFTGATSQKLGRFELADGGTLFLDEIGDISPSTQIKLLRVLQEREFVRVGGSKTVTCDVRIIAATNRDLAAAIRAGQFREDLYYRLNVFPIELPPLRQRREDIPLLIEHFVRRAATEMACQPPGVADGALRHLVDYRWPGNIRELRNVTERAVLMCDCGVIEPAHLPREIVQPEAVRPAPRRGGAVSADDGVIDAAPGESVLADQERALVEEALRSNAWNQTQAAKALGISRDNLRYRVKKYNLARPG